MSYRASVLLLLVACSPEAQPAHSRPTNPTASTPDTQAVSTSSSGRVVLLELYTSQGCSSCPPADALVAELDLDPSLQVVPLAFHVDYWDDLGWKDPYASPRWTQRQRAAAAAMGTRRVYTPQLLVDGHDPRVGHSRISARRAIAAAASRPALVDLNAQVTTHADRIAVTVDVTARTEAQIMVALYEDGIETDVTRGENAGRRLEHHGVVVDLHRACAVEPSAESHRCAVEFDAASSDLDLARAGVAAFAQSAQRPTIVGATRIRLAAGAPPPTSP